MDALKNWIISISAVIIFITAIEMILPNNNLKKYSKFVFGIILTITIIKPIFTFLSKGPDDFSDNVKKYIDENKYINEDEEAVNKFTNKELSDSVKRLLKEKFKDKDFSVQVQGEVNNKKYTVNIDKVKVGVKQLSIKKVENVDINKKHTTKKYDDVVSYLEEILKINDNQIEIFEME